MEGEAAPEGLLEEAPSRRDGLGMGGARPSREGVAQLHQKMAAQQAQAQREAAMQPGLNKKAAGAAPGAAPGAARGPVGPMGPPRGGVSQPPGRRPVGPQAAEKEEDVDMAWAPPQNQSGDGKTALNKKLGY
mgnify:FL=1